MKPLHLVISLALQLSTTFCFAGWNVPVINYTVADYAAGTQNWQMLTTANGWLYVANNNGLLEYDGSQWTVYGMYYGNLPRSIAKMHDDAILIGGTNDFGIFTPNAKGRMQYTSLLQSAGCNNLNFGEVWDIKLVGSQVYFFARHHIITAQMQFADSIRLTEVQILPMDSRIFCAQEVGGAIYVGTGDGLYLLSGLRMNRIHGSDAIGKYEVRGIQALDERRLLIATDLGGLYAYDGVQVTPFRTDADAFIRHNQLYALAVQGNRIAVGTVQQGIVVMEADGTHCRYISRSEGLQNNTILSMTFDALGNLWVGLDQGIDYVQLSAGRLYLHDEQVNYGVGYAVEECVEPTADTRKLEGVAQRYYLGTNQGLYIADGADHALHLVEGSMGQVWNLCRIGDALFCCHNRGLFLVEGTRLIPICTDEGFWQVRQLPDGRLLAGTYSGFRLLTNTQFSTSAGTTTAKRPDTHWQVTNVNGFDETAFRWQVDATGAIWVVAAYGIVRLDWTDATTLRQQPVQPYDGMHSWFNISRMGDKILISSNTYCRVVQPDGTLRRDTALFALLGGETFYALTYKDANDNLLYVRDRTLYIRAYSPESASYSPEYALYNGDSHFVGGFENIYETPDGYVVGLLQGFCKLQPALRKHIVSSSLPQIYLRNVTVVSQDMQVVYGESLDAACSSLPSTISTQPTAVSTKQTRVFELPYDSYVLRFACSIDQAPADNVQYAYRLLPRDKTYTPFTNQAYYECSALKEGNYTLEVICRAAVAGKAQTEVAQSWSFAILPPWYKTWWARTLWVLIVLAVNAFIGYFLYMMAERERGKALHEKQLQILQLENEKTQLRLQSKSQELTRIMHDESTKQEDLAYTSEQLDKCLHDLQMHNVKKVEERLQGLKQHIAAKSSDESIDWQRFEENFDEVNAGFCKRLTERFPWMNKQERKLCVYIYMGMLTKEMAPLLGLSTRGVEMMRYRMRCKMQLEAQANLKDYLLSLTDD